MTPLVASRLVVPEIQEPRVVLLLTLCNLNGIWIVVSPWPLYMFALHYIAAAVSCSPDPYRLGGVGFGFWLTGKLG